MCFCIEEQKRFLSVVGVRRSIEHILLGYIMVLNGLTLIAKVAQGHFFYGRVRPP